MATLKSKSEYAKNIAREWLKHATAADEAAETPGALFDQSFHAFMANAINAAVLKAAPDIREQFADAIHAHEYN